MESGINRVSIAKTIHIPPKHNGAISVSIKGHDIKTPTACFVRSQYTDTDVKLVDGVHDISHNTTLQVLVINNSNHHVNFPKGMKTGHLEPPIDDLTQMSINSATTQKMLPETVKLDSFTPPKYCKVLLLAIQWSWILFCCYFFCLYLTFGECCESVP